MADAREPIPAGIKRDLRQRCGFGCVLCGSPVFDYEHIDGYGVTGHDPAAMTLLCTMHHREKSAGRLPVSMVRRADADPHNRSRSLGAKHDLFFEGNTFTVNMGSTTFTKSKSSVAARAIEIDGEAVVGFSFSEGRILLDITIRDQDNVPLVVVRKGQLRHAVHAWDVVFEGTKLSVRRGPRDIALEIKLSPPAGISIERAEIWCRGILVRVGKSCSKAGLDVEVANNGVGLIGGTWAEFTTLLALGDYLGLEGAAWTTSIGQRWEGGIPAPAGTFSKKGGGQKFKFTNPVSVQDDCHAVGWLGATEIGRKPSPLTC
ncbi:hypothetical protein [Arthrobacter sp. HMWF013]|uniref:hypothetical protein n=1 Tax=Arthrobacter sp. HMWF013 TaxID=2056849 RepID=UPI000D3C2C3D|nr:hypothetical protein [Arthrobacter sp. HMWF013]PTT66830.1 hypothetical protein DBR22_10195 [Arthrobacter sp. HMWF013]